MSEFSAEWLALREPADWQSRSTRVTEAIVEVLPKERAVRAIDLAAGTGSNARFLARTMPMPQAWLLVDHDAALLESALDGWPALTFALRPLISRQTPGLTGLVAQKDFVTASALLDLVSAQWLASGGAPPASVSDRPCCLHLSYDGRMNCLPEEPEDELRAKSGESSPAYR